MNNNALAVIQEHEKKQDLVFVRPEDLNTQRMFVSEVTVLHARFDDFHKISGKMQPKGYYVDRIGQAAGVDFVAENCGVRKEGENVYIGFAQGRRRLPDGTWRNSVKHEYEYDVESRAEEDFLKDSKQEKKDQKYSTEIEKKQHTLELKRFARQKAGTGAHLKVIRELVGIPIGFKPEEVKKAIVVSRISVNTDEMLSTPGMQQAVIQQAVGAQQAIFGPGQGNTERDITPEKRALPETEQPQEQAQEQVAEQQAEEEKPIPFEDDIPWDEDPRDVVRRGLRHYVDNNKEIYLLPAQAIDFIQSALSVKNATLEALQDCEKRIKDYIARKEHGNEKYAAHMKAMREAGRVIT